MQLRQGDGEGGEEVGRGREGGRGGDDGLGGQGRMGLGGEGGPPACYCLYVPTGLPLCFPYL